jgi:hypothetical protein
MTTTCEQDRADRIFEQAVAIAIGSVAGSIILPGADTTPSAKR